MNLASPKTWELILRSSKSNKYKQFHGKKHFQKVDLAAILDFQVASRADLFSIPMRIIVPNLVLVFIFGRGGGGGGGGGKPEGGGAKISQPIVVGGATFF